MSIARPTIAAVAVVGLLVACSGPDDAPADPAPEVSETAEPDADDPSEPEPSAADEPVEVPLPDTPVGGQLAWVLDTLADDPPSDESVWTARFDEAFLTEVPVQQLRMVFSQFRADWTVTAYEGSPDGLEGVATIREPGGSEFELLGIVEAASPHRFTGLLFRPPTEPIEPPEDFDELAERLGEAVDTGVVLAAEVDDGACEPLYADDADTVVPIGSIFKLYVLGAVADAVAAGEVGWDDELTIRDERKSLPSGRLQDEPDGTTVSVRDAALGMIEISDNTATDLLIDLVGRETVEAAQADYGHHDPSLNVPFLTTRELFQLKWQLDDDEREAYLAADAEGRRGFLDDDLAERPLDVDVGDVTTPTELETLEWFATAEDLCRAHVGLAGRGDQDPVVREILAANPGVAVDPQVWPYVGFKGGSEPGLMALSWYLESADGDAHVLVTVAVDPDALLDDTTLIQLGSAGIDLLAAR
ncbi:MAG TPA: serine hydrolase [Egicoccus sp.]|nr:serine hydrolase [Egicoccus sp.]HSK21832.1 serine hydrolase [Egicoccus sp.]